MRGRKAKLIRKLALISSTANDIKIVDKRGCVRHIDGSFKNLKKKYRAWVRQENINIPRMKGLIEQIKFDARIEAELKKEQA